jgi:hypothetical protein
MRAPKIDPKQSSVDKLESQELTKKYNDFCKFRAIVYAKLMRKMIDAFGEDVLDIGEGVRRDNGRYSGERHTDVIANERKYDEDPAILIRELDDDLHGYSATWSRTCPCSYNAEPQARYHELFSLWCIYADAFRSVHEEKIGISWCCWDMGITPTLHPLFCQYMPKHQLKGDNLCYQVRGLADTPEEQAYLNSIEHTGWRSWK